MNKVIFHDGIKIKNAVVTINGEEYIITPAQYSGTTPISSFLLNKLQNNIEEAINGVSSVITLTEIIQANTNYTIPLNYHVNKNELDIFYCDTKLKKNIDYIEIGESGAISNIVQFTESLGNLDMTGVEGLENFKETLEFVVRGDYSDNNQTSDE